MVLFAEIHATHPDMALVRTIDHCSSHSIQAESQPLWDAGGPLVFVSTDHPAPATFRERLAADPTVTDLKVAQSAGNRTVYRVRIVPDAAILAPALAELGIRIDRAVGRDGGWSYAMKLPDRDALTGYREVCEERDIDFSINQLYRPMAGGDVDDESLSSCLHETLLVAYEAGYFEVPRKISQAELASHLEISPSALSQRLRRATRLLLEQAMVAERV